MKNSMQALVARDGEARIENRPIPEPKYGEVVVRTTVASICSADPSSVSGGFEVVKGAESESGTKSRSVVIGHEGVGVVSALGEGVRGFKLDDRVVSVATTSCGVCHSCQLGIGGHCHGVQWGGYLLGFRRDGTLAEYFAVPDAQYNLALIPDGVSDMDALFVTDSFATGSSAVEGAQLPLGGSTVILGQGHIGLGATAAARVAGAALVITVTRRPSNTHVSTSMGADIVLNHAEHDVVTEVLRLTGGQGADLVIEASGVTDAFELALELTRLGGQVSGIGTYTDSKSQSLRIPLSDWGWGVGNKSIRTSYQRTGSERTLRMLNILKTGRTISAPMFTHEYDFSNVLLAMKDVADKKPGLVKPLIRF